VVELVDTPDLKSCGRMPVRVQVPPRVQKQCENILFFFILALILIVHILNLLIMKFEFQNLTIYKKAKEFHQAAKISYC
jgi:hypothetical protein